MRVGAAISHSQSHEPSWERSYIAYPGKETRSNFHEWVMALVINRDIVLSALDLSVQCPGVQLHRKEAG